MTTLFMHNTITNYRLPLFQLLATDSSISFVFTDMLEAKSVYGFEIDSDVLPAERITILDTESLCNAKKQLRHLLSISHYDNILIPAPDNFRALQLASCVISNCAPKTKILLFWEKWIAPIKSQPIKKRIKNQLQIVMCKHLLSKVDLFIASGSKTKNFFEKSLHIPTSKIRVIFDASQVNKMLKATEASSIRKRYGIMKNEILFLYFGRLIERKGILKLIKALSKLSKYKFKLLVCGDGPVLKEAQELSEKLLSGRVIFTGAISPIERVSYFSEADLFVLPSYFQGGIVEAWGLSVNEALECGTPVLATTAVGAAFDLIIDGTNGYIAQENSVEKLRQKLEHFLTVGIPDSMNLCGSNWHTYERMADEFKTVFNE